MKLREGDAAWEDLRLHAADWPGFTCVCVWSIGGGSEEIRGRDCCVGRLGLNPAEKGNTHAQGPGLAGRIVRRQGWGQVCVARIGALPRGGGGRVTSVWVFLAGRNPE